MKCVIVMTLSYGRALNGKTRAKPPCMAQWRCLFSQTLALSTQHNMRTCPSPRPADRSGQVVAPEPGQVGTSIHYTDSTLARCWSEESQTAGHYNWLELDYQHCPHAPSVSWHKCSELTAVQPQCTVKWTTVDICQVWKTGGWQKSRQQ